MNEGLSHMNCVVVIMNLNNIHKFVYNEIDVLDSDSYEKFYGLGFRPQVSGAKEELLKSWRYLNKTIYILVYSFF